jgi:hypothetical protein
LIEVIVLGLNGCRCPLTFVAGPYIADRRPNFDIYIPDWIGAEQQADLRHVVAGTVLTLARWTFGAA